MSAAQPRVVSYRVFFEGGSSTWLTEASANEQGRRASLARGYGPGRWYEIVPVLDTEIDCEFLT